MIHEPCHKVPRLQSEIQVLTRDSFIEKHKISCQMNLCDENNRSELSASFEFEHPSFDDFFRAPKRALGEDK